MFWLCVVLVVVWIILPEWVQDYLLGGAMVVTFLAILAASGGILWILFNMFTKGSF
jgi:hypothetical protein